MEWNWQQPDWPNFSWDEARLRKAEAHFLVSTGMFAGALKHLPRSEQEQLTVESISAEAVTTPEIEGEILDRASVQSSIRRQFGLATDNRKVRPAEEGVSEMMVDLYRTFAEPISHEMLFSWHRMLFKEPGRLIDVGPLPDRRGCYGNCFRPYPQAESTLRSAASGEDAERNGAVRWLVQSDGASGR
jgi:Fic family protein